MVPNRNVLVPPIDGAEAGFLHQGSRQAVRRVVAADCAVELPSLIILVFSWLCEYRFCSPIPAGKCHCRSFRSFVYEVSRVHGLIETLIISTAYTFSTVRFCVENRDRVLHYMY